LLLYDSTSKIRIYNNVHDDKSLQLCQPDATTYEILLLALHHRWQVNSTAIQFIWKTLMQPSKKQQPKFTIAWTPELLEVVLQICNECQDVKLARVLLTQLLDVVEVHDDDKNKTIPTIQFSSRPITKRTYHALINIMKVDKATDDITRICELALQVRKNI
jgi:hypothetical protein